MTEKTIQEQIEAIVAKGKENDKRRLEINYGDEGYNEIVAQHAADARQALALIDGGECTYKEQAALYEAAINSLFVYYSPESAEIASAIAQRATKLATEKKGEDKDIFNETRIELLQTADIALNDIQVYHKFCDPAKFDYHAYMDVIKKRLDLIQLNTDLGDSEAFYDAYGSQSWTCYTPDLTDENIPEDLREKDTTAEDVIGEIKELHTEKLRAAIDMLVKVGVSGFSLNADALKYAEDVLMAMAEDKLSEADVAKIAYAYASLPEEDLNDGLKRALNLLENYTTGEVERGSGITQIQPSTGPSLSSMQKVIETYQQSRDTCKPEDGAQVEDPRTTFQNNWKNIQRSNQDAAATTPGNELV